MEKMAEDKKEDGNNFYRQKNYSGALKLYTEAIGQNFLLVFSFMLACLLSFVLNCSQRLFLNGRTFYLSTDLCPDCAAYYTNRAAAYVMLELYEKALEDCRRALRIDPHCTKVDDLYYSVILSKQYTSAYQSATAIHYLFSYLKASLREAKCHLAMGEPAAANMSYEIVLRREPDNKAARAEVNFASASVSYISRD